MTRTELYMTANHLSPDEIVSATGLDCERDIRGITGEGAYAIAGYCSQPTVERCSLCSLCNYGLDCHNNPVAK
jgi:hypothetical protein